MPEPEPEKEAGYGQPAPASHINAEMPSSAPTIDNIAPGVTSDCAEYYIVRAGDFCYSIAQAFGTTFEKLQKLNTNLDENCSNLWKDYAYCVKGF